MVVWAPLGWRQFRPPGVVPEVREGLDQPLGEPRPVPHRPLWRNPSWLLAHFVSSHEGTGQLIK